MSQKARRQLIDGMQELNRIQLGALGDPEIATHIENYEMAYRMQTSVPELMDISKEPKSVLEMYGAEPGKASFANNCLLARRLAERGVRFIQLCHRDWDHHGNLPNEIRKQAKLTDQPSAALIKDLKATRPARRHAGHLGRRIRPHHLQPGRNQKGQFRSRPSSPLFQPLDGWRWHQTRA